MPATSLAGVITLAPDLSLGRLGYGSGLQSAKLDEVARRIAASPQQTALAWLLQHSPVIAVIPGTSSVEHLRENVTAADLTLSPQKVADLDAIGV